MTRPTQTRVARMAVVPCGSVARWALAVAVVLGVLGMHALMGPPGIPGGAGGPMSAAMPMSVSMAPAVAVDAPQHVGGDHLGAAQAGAAGGAVATNGGDAPVGGHSPAGGHSMLTMCLAVLGALTFLVLLAAAAVRRSARFGEPGTGTRRATRSARRRPPPWTVPSLHQLSLLRV